MKTAIVLLFTDAVFIFGLLKLMGKRGVVVVVGCWYTLPPPCLTYNHIIVPARPYKTGLNSYQMVLLPRAHGNIFLQK